MIFTDEIEDYGQVEAFVFKLKASLQKQKIVTSFKIDAAAETLA